jgi:hypothetical protein
LAKEENLDVVHDCGNALDALYGGFGTGLQGGPSYLAEERHLVPIHFVSQVVEHRVVRQHHQLVAYFLHQLFLGFFTALFTCALRPSGRGEWQRGDGRGEKHSYKQRPRLVFTTSPYSVLDCVSTR